MSIEDRLEHHTSKNRIAPDSRGKYADDVMGGVTQAWLSQAFRLAPNTVKAKLAGCPIMARRSRGEKMVTTYYDLATAASYLAKPRQDSREFYRALKRGDIPPALSQAFWDALLKRQKYEENAGELWRTSKVRDVLGSTFQTIKFTMQLWVETISQTQELSDEQRAMIQQMVDALQKDVYDALVRNAAEKMTGPMIEELPAMIGENLTIQQVKGDLEDDDDGMELV